MGGAIFAQFFLLTLYMQQVLHYSAIQTGVAYIGLTLTIIVFSVLAQALVTRLGVRRILPLGLALSTVALVWFARLPVHGHYFSNLFPPFIISGLGLALAFVPMSIGALTGVQGERRRDRVGPDQHDPADRRGDRRRGRDDRRDDVHRPLCRCPRRELVQPGRIDARVPDRVLRPGRNGSFRGGARSGHARVEARGGRRADARARAGGSMKTIRQRLDDLTLELQGLVLVRALLELRGIPGGRDRQARQAHEARSRPARSADRADGLAERGRGRVNPGRGLTSPASGCCAGCARPLRGRAPRGGAAGTSRTFRAAPS